MSKKVAYFRRMIILTVVCFAAMTAVSFFFSRELFYILLGLTLVCSVVLIISAIRFHRDIYLYADDLIHQNTTLDKERMVNFPIPMCVTGENGEILWYNDRFIDAVVGDKALYGEMLEKIAPEVALSDDCPAGGFMACFGGKQYTVFAASQDNEIGKVYTVYFVEDTQLKWFRNEYLQSHPVVFVIQVDNYEELLQNAKENARPHIMSEIEVMITGTMKEYHALTAKLERDMYISIVEERYMAEIVKGKFSILDRARAIKASNTMFATLSVGVGRDAPNLEQAERLAQQALEMSRGRGGDQAAVRTRSGYEFYGGVSQAVEKRTKVKTRIIAAALSELIQTSSNVLVMGHKFADLDCLGAAMGIYRGVSYLGKRVHVVMHKSKNLVNQLMARLTEQGYGEIFLNPEEASSFVGKDTLLIVVDTHIPSFLESEELYTRCRSVMVIDHHRKAVNYIHNAVIFYHEPFASSASEMVTELVQYLGFDCRPTKLEAEALLAGIMLDTKNFVVKTGVRTFEAAAYLRKVGADTVDVRKLFSSSLEEYQHKSQVVSSADVYKGCAISMLTGAGRDENVRLIAPQAADELLNISGVDASFVIYENEEEISISARSMGKMNVQVVMESLGGGGHLTMAAAQFRDQLMEDVRQRLFEAIDRYIEENSKS